MLARLLTWLSAGLPDAPERPRMDGGLALVTVLAAAALTLSHYDGDVSTWNELIAPRLHPHGALLPIADHLYWFGASFVLYAAVPLAVLAAAREPLSGLGLGFGRWRFGLAVAAALYLVMTAVVLVAARTPTFAGAYPLSGAAAASWRLFLPYEAAYALYFVAWELLFRGWLLFGLHRRIGAAAVWVLAIPFATMHLGKPQPEALGSIAAAVALGYLALKTRSFWYGALLHACVAVTMDFAAAWHRLPHR